MKALSKINNFFNVLIIYVLEYKAKLKIIISHFLKTDSYTVNFFQN